MPIFWKKFAINWRDRDQSKAACMEDLGDTIRDERHKLTLKRLPEETSLSLSFLGHVERVLTQPHIRSRWGTASIFQPFSPTPGRVWGTILFQPSGF